MTTNLYTTTIAPTIINATAGDTSAQGPTTKSDILSSAAVTTSDNTAKPVVPSAPSAGTDNARTGKTAARTDSSTSPDGTGTPATNFVTTPNGSTTAVPQILTSSKTTSGVAGTVYQTLANSQISDSSRSAGGSVVTINTSTTATTPHGNDNMQLTTDSSTSTIKINNNINGGRKNLSTATSSGNITSNTSISTTKTTIRQQEFAQKTTKNMISANSNFGSKATTATTTAESRNFSTTGQPRDVNRNTQTYKIPPPVYQSQGVASTLATPQSVWNDSTLSSYQTSLENTGAWQYTTKEPPQNSNPHVGIVSNRSNEGGSSTMSQSFFTTTKMTVDYFTKSFPTKGIVKNTTGDDSFYEIPTTKGNIGTIDPVDSYNDPIFPCFDKYVRKSHSPSIIFLTGSYTPQQCFVFCNATFSCRAFQVSRSGSGVCGYFETQQDSSEFHDSTTTSIYTFSQSCIKTPLKTNCITSNWFNTTYRCTSGLVAREHIQSEDDCKAYCACGLQNCMAAVVRNNSGVFECYVVLDGADLSNFQLCNVAVKQYIIDDYGNDTLGVTKAPSIPSKDSTYYNTTCWNPPTVDNSDHYLYKDQHGMAVVYICNQGYLFPSGEKVRTLVCTRLAWGFIQPMCLPTKCSYPPLTYEPFEVIERSCPGPPGLLDTKPPYFRAGLKIESSKCTIENLVPQLIPEPSDCNFTCQSPLLIYNTSATFRPYKKTVHYKCFKGHRFADGRNRKLVRCFNNGSWPETEPCSALFCDDILKRRKVVLSTGNTIFGTIVTVTCEKGYMFPLHFNRKVMECIEAMEQDRITAVWNDTVEACTDVVCTNPYTNDTSRTISSDPNVLNKSLYSYLEVIEYVCKDYNLKFDDGTKKRLLTCSDNGLWNFDNVHCGANRCDPIPYIFEAQASTILALKDTNVTFTCNEGLWFEKGLMTMNIVCNGVAWIQPKYAKCEVVTCLVDTDSTSQWNTTDDLIQYGTSIQVHCNPGHYLFDTPTRQSSRNVACTKYGNWSENVHCMPVNCGPVVGVTRASVEDNPQTTFNSTIHYICLNGHWFGRDGYQVVAKCNEEGMWADPDDVTDARKWRSCVEIKCLPLLTYSTSNLTTSVGSSGNVTCPPDRKFKDIQDIHIKVACNSWGEWMPELPECIATQSVANFTVAEAPKAGVIAVVALVIVVIEIACFILLDLPALKTSIQYLIGNLGRCKNKCMKK